MGHMDDDGETVTLKATGEQVRAWVKVLDDLDFMAGDDLSMDERASLGGLMLELGQAAS